MELFERLIDTERRLWTNDPDLYEAAYDEDAMLIFSEVGRINRTLAVAAIREENKNGKHWAEVRFEDVATSQLAPDVVLLVY